MANANWNEIAATRSEIAGVNARLYDCENEKARLQEKIERLKVAKRQWIDRKHEVIAQKNVTNSNIALAGAWKGTKKEEFQTLAEEGLMEGYRRFDDQMERALDEINNEITRLENEVYEQDGVIGWLRSRINSLGNYLENLFN